MQQMARTRMDVQIHIPDSLKQKKKEPIKPLHQIGDTVMHPSEGICIIEKIEKLKFNSSTADNLYYILKPSMVKSSSVVYLPVDRGNSLLRHLLVKADIDRIISESVDYPSLWIDDNKQRKESFNALLTEGNYVKLIRMIQDIHEHNASRIAEGKKPCAADENILDEAERLLHQEFSYVLEMSTDDVADYIRARKEDLAEA